MINNITLNGDRELAKRLEEVNAELENKYGEGLKEYACVSKNKINENLMFIWAPEIRFNDLCNLLEHETLHLVLHKIGEHRASNNLNNITTNIEGGRIK